jgi:hypothetical protein
MTKENAEEFLPIVQALAEGKTIQFGGLQDWSDIRDVLFDSEPEYYRIKPMVQFKYLNPGEKFRYEGENLVKATYNGTPAYAVNPETWNFKHISHEAEVERI